MTHEHQIVSPSRTGRFVFFQSGEKISPPADWSFLQAGDAAITRKVKSMGPTWVVQIKKGKRHISKGIWANSKDISTSQKEVELKRSTPQYAKKRASDLARRESKQRSYVKEFFNEVVNFLNFHPRYREMESLLAEKVTAHATPVGSGTVARTTRIPVKQRAESAVIAWMRHQTTAYDMMQIARIKGRRREVRRKLAQRSVEILKVYRQGLDNDDSCPLKQKIG